MRFHRIVNGYGRTLPCMRPRRSSGWSCAEPSVLSNLTLRHKMFLGGRVSESASIEEPHVQEAHRPAYGRGTLDSRGHREAAQRCQPKSASRPHPAAHRRRRPDPWTDRETAKACACRIATSEARHLT